MCFIAVNDNLATANGLDIMSILLNAFASVWIVHTESPWSVRSYSHSFTYFYALFGVAHSEWASLMYFKKYFVCFQYDRYWKKISSPCQCCLPRLPSCSPQRPTSCSGGRKPAGGGDPCSIICFSAHEIYPWCSDVKAKSLPAGSEDPDLQQRYTFYRSMCDRSGIFPDTFFLLMCATSFIIRPSTAVKVLSASFWSDADPRHFYSMSGYVQRVSSPTTIHFTPALSQGVLPQDRDALSYSQRLLWQPRIKGRITPNMALKDRNNSISKV